jgi:pyruvate dehydrogenase E1 component
MGQGINDIDPTETQEWRDAMASVLRVEGPERAQFILAQLSEIAEVHGVQAAQNLITPYINTLSVDQEPDYPGDLLLEKRINAIIRWNAVCMVLRAVKYAPELGGHLSTFASAAVLYAVAQHHFFRGADAEQGGDLVFFQGHAAPGMYSRAFLEGRLSEEQLTYFRREVGNHQSLSSYPHPWLMPDFWQFPTVSMGIGIIQSIYQARFLKYLDYRGLQKTDQRKVWVFCGDGEMDEPESTGALHIAGKEALDNLIFVVNCNLQRLDGPVRGNGCIVNELEGVFKGSGWRVIKVLWGSGWDKLFAKDKAGLLMKRMGECVDGDYQNYRSKDGAYIREHFFGKYPELKALVADMSDEEIWELKRGGHDFKKVYAAYKEAVEVKGQPVALLMQTIKGYGLEAGESHNTAHSLKKMSLEEVKQFRDRFQVPIDDADIESLPFYRPPEDSPEVQYVQQSRKKLGGSVPARVFEKQALTVPSLSAFAKQLESTGDREISNTMAFVRVLNALMKDKTLGKRIVPIVPDEGRTFGMEGMFRQYGIYSHLGQLYEPEDKGQVMYYKEAQNGQILEEGINEAGAFASFIAAGTSYANSNYPMIPFCIYYSMFGFQRAGDLTWAAGDIQAKGFLMGAVSGRTTLAGEGLQHQDGHNIVLAGTIPNCISYDPCYSYEVAVIVQDGLRRMYHDNEKVYYYITLGNEAYAHPAMPENAEEGIIKGMYRLKAASSRDKLHVQLLGSGAILREVEAAAEMLEKEFDVHADIWSAPSFNELYREGMDIDRWNMLHPEATAKISYVEQCLGESNSPVIASTDYIKLYAEQIRTFVPGKYYVLGTDGFGRSDTREQLRAHFEVDRRYVVIAALKALADEGKIPAKTVSEAIKKYNIDSEKMNPLHA